MAGKWNCLLAVSKRGLLMNNLPEQMANQELIEIIKAHVKESDFMPFNLVFNIFNCLFL